MKNYFLDRSEEDEKVKSFLPGDAWSDFYNKHYKDKFNPTAIDQIIEVQNKYFSIAKNIDAKEYEELQ
jgi:hypothetical protein